MNYRFIIYLILSLAPVVVGAAQREARENRLVFPRVMVLWSEDNKEVVAEFLAQLESRPLQEGELQQLLMTFCAKHDAELHNLAPNYTLIVHRDWSDPSEFRAQAELAKLLQQSLTTAKPIRLVESPRETRVQVARSLAHGAIRIGNLSSENTSQLYLMLVIELTAEVKRSSQNTQRIALETIEPYPVPLQTLMLEVEEKAAETDSKASEQKVSMVLPKMQIYYTRHLDSIGLVKCLEYITNLWKERRQKANRTLLQAIQSLNDSMKNVLRYVHGLPLDEDIPLEQLPAKYKDLLAQRAGMVSPGAMVVRMHAEPRIQVVVPKHDGFAVVNWRFSENPFPIQSYKLER